MRPTDPYFDVFQTADELSCRIAFLPDVNTNLRFLAPLAVALTTD